MKNGMKQTAIGAIPLDWEVVQLREIISDLKSGVSVNSEDKRVTSPNQIGILKTSAIASGHFLQYQHKLVVDKDVHRAKLNPVTGSILISRMNTPSLVGDSCYIDKDYPNLFIPDRIWMTVFNTKRKINSRWLSFVLISDSFREIIRNTATGTSNSMKNISKGSFLSLEIPLPSLLEQRKIAEILFTLDEKMTVIDEQLAQTHELKKGLMHRLLTTGIGHTQFKDSPLGKIPANWEISSIDKHVSVIFGFPFKSEKFNQKGKGTRLLRGINITVGNLRWNESIDRYWDEHFNEYDKYALQEGDLVISMDGSLVGRNYARVNKSELPLLLVQRVACIRTKGTLGLEYLRQIIGGPLFINYVDAVKTSSGIPHISGRQIKDFKIPVPPLSEQENIAEILSTLDNKIGVLQDKKAQYHTLKKGLMQQLLTGQRRVRVAEQVSALV